MPSLSSANTKVTQPAQQLANGGVALALQPDITNGKTVADKPSEQKEGAQSPIDITFEQQRKVADAAVHAQVVDKIMDSNSRVRLAGIVQLASLPPEQSVPALQVAATSDADARNQLLAIQSLVTIARRAGDSDGNIRAILKQAMYAANPAAATAAKKAYESIGQDFNQ
ncbi:MAG: hypothetical protein AB7F79_02930 [Steroidobacteraceae bacterium]